MVGTNPLGATQFLPAPNHIHVLPSPVHRGESQGSVCALSTQYPSRSPSSPLARNKETPNFSLQQELAPSGPKALPSGPSGPLRSAPADPSPAPGWTPLRVQPCHFFSLTASPGSCSQLLELSREFPHRSSEEPGPFSPVLPFPSPLCLERPPDFNSRLEAGHPGVNTSPATCSPSLPCCPLPPLPATFLPLPSTPCIQPPEVGGHPHLPPEGAWVTIGAVTAETNDDKDFHGSLRPRGRSVRPSLRAPRLPSAARPLSHLRGCGCTASRTKQPLQSAPLARGRGGRAARVERGGGGERGACWHPEEEHVCSWPAAWGQKLDSSSRARAHTHTHTHTLTHTRACEYVCTHLQAGHKARQRKVTVNPTLSP